MKNVKRKRKRVRISHRTHPAKVFRAPPGYCQWCHQETHALRDKFCGLPCKDAYALHTNPKVWRAEVWRRERGICRECGTKHPLDGRGWHADHKLPLFIAGNDWNFWSPENGCVLCKDPCHKEKTKADAIRFSVEKPKRTRRM